VEELLDYIYRYKPDLKQNCQPRSENHEQTGEGYQPLFDNNKQTGEGQSVTTIITNSCSKLGRDNIITEHRLQAFSPAYFSKDSNLFTYSIENLQAAQKTGIKGVMEVPFFKDPLPDPPDTFKTIQIKDLCNFYNNPCRYLLQKRLGLSLDVVSEEVSDDEPFDLKGLSGYSIAEKLIENSIDGIPYDKSYQQFKRSGFLPHGSVGAYHFDNLQSGTSGFVEKLSGYLDDDPLDNLRVDYQIEDFHLTGTINRIWKNNLVHFRYAKVKPTDMLHIWIKHLVLNACRQPQYPSRSLLFSRDGSWGYYEIPNAAELLLKLLSFYLKGLSQPLQFLPASSWEYADTIINRKKTEDIAMDNALKRWRGNDFSSVPGESADPYVSLCYRSATPFGEQFPINSTDIYGPLIQHMEILG
jgi:exodeoxyribonuclease V gamma subunit